MRSRNVDIVFSLHLKIVQKEDLAWEDLLGGRMGWKWASAAALMIPLVTWSHVLPDRMWQYRSMSWRSDITVTGVWRCLMWAIAMSILFSIFSPSALWSHGFTWVFLLWEYRRVGFWKSFSFMASKFPNYKASKKFPCSEDTLSGKFLLGGTSYRELIWEF